MVNINLPKIEHAKVNLNERNRVIIEMEAGWGFYFSDIYSEETPKEEIGYSIWGSLSPETDFSLLVVEKIPNKEEQK